MTKLKLKKKYKQLIATAISIIVIAILSLYCIERIDNIANQCDESKGRTCSAYEVNLFTKIK